MAAMRTRCPAPGKNIFISGYGPKMIIPFPGSNARPATTLIFARTASTRGATSSTVSTASLSRGAPRCSRAGHNSISGIVMILFPVLQVRQEERPGAGGQHRRWPRGGLGHLCQVPGRVLQRVLGVQTV